MTENTVNVVVTAVEKETLWSKTKNTASKVVHSKPFKIIGGIGLAAAGGFVGYSVAKKGDDQPDYDYDCECYDEDELEPEVEIPDEQVND